MGVPTDTVNAYDLEEGDFRGDRFSDHSSDLKGNNDLLTLTQPKIIEEIHRAFLEAGCDIVETNTFNSNAISQADYSLEAIVYELNFEAAKIANSESTMRMESSPMVT